MIQMKERTVFVTDDGREFQSRSQAEKHQKLLERLQQIETLPPRRRDIAHGKWIQHPVEQYRKWRMALVKMTKEYFPDTYPDADPMEIHPHSYMGRVVDDSGPDPLRKQWQRLACTTDDGREFDQPYFALNPDKAEGPMA